MIRLKNLRLKKEYDLANYPLPDHFRMGNLLEHSAWQIIQCLSFYLLRRSDGIFFLFLALIAVMLIES